MAAYDKSGGGFLYFPPKNDNYAKYMLGYTTADDVRKAAEQCNILEVASTIRNYIRFMEETEKSLKLIIKIGVLPINGLLFLTEARLTLIKKILHITGV